VNPNSLLKSSARYSAALPQARTPMLQSQPMEYPVHQFPKKNYQDNDPGKTGNYLPETFFNHAKKHDQHRQDGRGNVAHATGSRVDA
jgi:hypothetical protein